MSGSPSPEQMRCPSFEGAPPSANLSPREREILRSAIERFAQSGFASTDVQQIADDVGIGKGTIYRCFSSKEALFLAAARYARDCVVEAVDEANRNETDPLAYLQKGMRAFLRYFDQHPEVVELLIEERALTRGKRVATFFDKDGTRRECWRKNFEELLKAGILREMPINEIEEAISRSLWGALFVNYFAGTPAPLEGQFEKVFETLIHGIGANKLA